VRFWRRVKFWRHLVVVAFAVAVVVVLGLVWEHSSAAGWITPPGPPGAGRIPAGGEQIQLLPGGRLPPGFHLPKGARVVQVRNEEGERGMWLDPSDVGNLTSTVEVVAAVMAGVIVLDIARRRARKARRAAAISASSPET
jgi:hypothetical protein